MAGAVRKIESKMVKFLDGRLKNNGLVQHAIETGDARAIIVPAASVCVGIRESGGNNRGFHVSLIQDTVGTAVGEPWCMSFVQTLIAYAELKTGKVSPLAVSEGCSYTWGHTPKKMRVKIHPLAGAVFFMKRPTTYHGHTGIVVSADNRYMYTIEGNTTSGVDKNGDVERDGGGVYYNRRPIKGTKSFPVTGFLKPF